MCSVMSTATAQVPGYKSHGPYNHQIMDIIAHHVKSAQRNTGALVELHASLISPNQQIRMQSSVITTLISVSYAPYTCNPSPKSSLTCIKIINMELYET